MTILSFFTAPESYFSLAFKTPPVILIILVVISGLLGLVEELSSPEFPPPFPSTVSFELLPELPSTGEFSLIIEIFLSLGVSSFDGCCGVIFVVLSGSFKSEAYNEI